MPAQSDLCQVNLNRLERPGSGMFGTGEENQDDRLGRTSGHKRIIWVSILLIKLLPESPDKSKRRSKGGTREGLHLNSDLNKQTHSELTLGSRLTDLHHKVMAYDGSCPITTFVIIKFQTLKTVIWVFE